MDKKEEKQNAARLAKIMALMYVRNTGLKNIHAVRSPISEKPPAETMLDNVRLKGINSKNGDDRHQARGHRLPVPFTIMAF